MNYAAAARHGKERPQSAVDEAVRIAADASRAAKDHTPREAATTPPPPALDATVQPVSPPPSDPAPAPAPPSESVEQLVVEVQEEAVEPIADSEPAEAEPENEPVEAEAEVIEAPVEPVAEIKVEPEEAAGGGGAEVEALRPTTEVAARASWYNAETGGLAIPSLEVAPAAPPLWTMDSDIRRGLAIRDFGPLPRPELTLCFALSSL